MRFSQDGVQDYATPDPGEYTGTVVSAAEEVSQKGNEMVHLEFEVPFEKDGRQYTIRVHYYVVSHVRDRVEGMIKALCPEKMDEWERTGGFDLEPRDLCGRDCQVILEHEEWQGKTRAKVDYIDEVAF